MKQIYLFITALLVAFNLNAQITLTSSANSLEVGEVDYVLTQDYTFDVSQNGPNQTWDFSSATGDVSSSEYIAAEDASDPSTFPNANIVEDFSYGFGPNVFIIESYYSSTDSGIAFEGELSPGNVTIYSDKKEVINFPITYNDVFNETFSGTKTQTVNMPQEEQYVYSITGTIEIVADGYGDLVLPDTTVSDVLRVRAIYEYNDSTEGEQNVYNDTIFSWYNSTQNSPIARTYSSYVNGIEALRLAMHLENFSTDTTISDTVNISEANINKLSFYPNPANNFVIVENVNGNHLPMDIYDIRGIRVKTVYVQNGKTRIDLSDLSSGVYFIKYINDSRLFTEKVLVNK